jgi:hypothetical protein
MYRSVLLAEALVNGEKVFVATTHLEGGAAEGRDLRAEQLAVIRDTLKS